MDGLEQQNFRVNLGGVIALLSKNLYFGPGVYVRELSAGSYNCCSSRPVWPASATAPRIEPCSRKHSTTSSCSPPGSMAQRSPDERAIRDIS